jgi:hypothetical protein
VPIERFILPVNKTKKEYYFAERNLYRLTHSLVRRGDLIDQRVYYHYSLIAKKYNWPFIKESYDQS